jgi:thiol:disulfide interchange protein
MKMKFKRIIWMSLYLVCSFVLSLGQVQERVKMSGVASVKAVKSEAFELLIEVDIEKKYHLYGEKIPEGLTGKPTQLEIQSPEGWQVKLIKKSNLAKLKSSEGVEYEGYEDQVSWLYEVYPIAEGVGEKMLSLQLSGLVCGESSCQPVKLKQEIQLSVGGNTVLNELYPKEKVESFKHKAVSQVKVDGEAKMEDKGSGWYFLMLAFLGGLILNLMPCVFPVLGLKVMSVVKQAKGEKLMIWKNALAYTLGVLVSFWILALAVLIIKSIAGGQITWGFQFKSPVFTFVVIHVMLLIGLNLLGVFEVGTSLQSAGGGLQSKDGTMGAFFSGLFATLVATPCAAPMLGTAITYALQLSNLGLFFYFSVIGIGLASPFIVLAAIPRLMVLLPKPGAWMEVFKQVMGFLMLMTVGYFVWSFEAFVSKGKLSEWGMLNLYISLVVMSMAVWVYGKGCLVYLEKKVRIRSGLIAGMLLLLSVGLGYPKERGAGLEWQVWSKELQEKYQQEGKIVYVDFTARWCATCQTNKRVYQDASLIELFKKKEVQILKADITLENVAVEKEMQRLNKSAIPINVYYLPSSKEPVFLSELLTVEGVKSPLK